jgi:hypothetical protein
MKLEYRCRLKTSGCCSIFAYGLRVYFDGFPEPQQFRTTHLPETVPQLGNVEFSMNPMFCVTGILHRRASDRERNETE